MLPNHQTKKMIYPHKMEVQERVQRRKLLWLLWPNRWKLRSNLFLNNNGMLLLVEVAYPKEFKSKKVGQSHSLMLNKLDRITNKANSTIAIMSALLKSKRLRCISSLRSSIRSRLLSLPRLLHNC
jgi:hypothetical protein